MMATLQVYATEGELRSIFYVCSIQHSLACYRSDKNDYEVLDLAEASLPIGWQTISKLYLVSKSLDLPVRLLASDFQPLEMGVIDIGLGHLIQTKDKSILTLTTVQAVNRRTLAF